MISWNDILGGISHKRYIAFREYLEGKDKWDFSKDEIEEWSGYFNQFFDDEDDLTVSIRDRISELLEKIGM